MTGISKVRTTFNMTRCCRLSVLCFMDSPSQTQPKDKEKCLGNIYRGAKLPIFDGLLGGDSFLKKNHLRVTQCKRGQTLGAVDSFIK